MNRPALLLTILAVWLFAAWTPAALAAGFSSQNRELRKIGVRVQVPGNPQDKAKPRTTSEEPFGQLIESSGDVDSFHLRFSGKYYDKETGFYDYVGRMYDPKTRQWLSRDPAGELADRNLYSFCNNDPINFVDPDGLEKVGSDPATTSAAAAAAYAVAKRAGKIAAKRLTEALAVRVGQRVAVRVGQGVAVRAASNPVGALVTGTAVTGTAVGGNSILYGDAWIRRQQAMERMNHPHIAPAFVGSGRPVEPIRHYGQEGDEAAYDEYLRTKTGNPSAARAFYQNYLFARSKGTGLAFLLTKGILSTSELTPGEYVHYVRPGAIQTRFEFPWTQGNFGVRWADDFDRVTGTIFEGTLLDLNTIDYTDISSRGFKQFKEKLKQSELDHWLLQNNPNVNRSIWFSPYPLPDTGPGSLLRQNLIDFGIEFWQVPLP